MDKVIDFNDYLTQKQQKEILKFLSLLTKLDGLELVGVAHILGVNSVKIQKEVESDPTIQDAKMEITNSILSETIDAFVQLDNNKRKNLFKLLRQCR